MSKAARVLLGLTVAGVALLVLVRSFRARPSAPQSCVGLPAVCGPNGNEDCCAGTLVPGGTFQRTHDAVGCPGPGVQATVSPFVLDRFEVTVGRFRRFLDRGGGTRAAPPSPGSGASPHVAGSGWRAEWNAHLEPDRATLEARIKCGASSWASTAADRDQLPINCVTFYEAFAFCAADGGRLPTEAEWNFAAAGGDEQRVFPWSSPPSSNAADPSRAVYARPRVERTGSHPAGDGRWGQADLAGNVWEWTLDTADPADLLPTVGRSRCELAGYPSPCVDCIGSAPKPGHVLRGGGFGIPIEGLYSSLRRASPSTDRYHVFGVRCARDANAATSTPPKPAAAPASAPLPSSSPAAPSPFSFARGEVLKDLAVRVVHGSKFDQATLFDLRASPSWLAGPARFVLLDLLTTRSPRAQGDQLHRWDGALGEHAACGVRLVHFVLEGDRAGQAADSYTVIGWAGRENVTHPAVFDPTGLVAASVGTQPRTLLVELSTMRVLEVDDGDAVDSPLRRTLSARCAAPAK